MLCFSQISIPKAGVCALGSWSGVDLFSGFLPWRNPHTPTQFPQRKWGRRRRKKKDEKHLELVASWSSEEKWKDIKPIVTFVP